MEKCVFYFWYTCTFFLHWNFGFITMKTKVFCICYEASTLIKKDKSDIEVVLKVLVIVYKLQKIWKTVGFFLTNLYFFFYCNFVFCLCFFIFGTLVLFISLKFCSLCVFFIFDRLVLFFFHWNFPVIAMKTNVFCICYEAATLVQRDKSEGKGSFKGICNGIWSS